MRKTRDVVCRKCNRSNRVPKNARLAGFGNSGVVCARRVDGFICNGEFKIPARRLEQAKG